MGRIFSGAVFGLESKLLLLNPATLVFLCFAWVVEAFLAFYAAPLWQHAAVGTLGPLAYVPWIFCLLIPLLVMNMGDDERSGRLERLLTLPIAQGALWVSRFMVYWLVLAVFLLGTLPLAATGLWLGHDHVELMAEAYGIVFVLGGLQLAAAFFLAAESGQPVVAFVTGFLLNLALLVAAWSEVRALVNIYPAGPVPDGLLGDALAVANMLFVPWLTTTAYLWYWRARRKRAVMG